MHWACARQQFISARHARFSRDRLAASRHPSLPERSGRASASHGKFHGDEVPRSRRHAGAVSTGSAFARAARRFAGCRLPPGRRLRAANALAAICKMSPASIWPRETMRAKRRLRAPSLAPRHGLRQELWRVQTLDAGLLRRRSGGMGRGGGMRLRVRLLICRRGGSYARLSAIQSVGPSGVLELRSMPKEDPIRSWRHSMRLPARSNACPLRRDDTTSILYELPASPAPGDGAPFRLGEFRRRSMKR